MTMENIRCNLCLSDNWVYLFAAQDWVFPSPEKFNFVKCRNCGLVFMNPRPTSEEMQTYYPVEYHQDYGRGKRELRFLSGNKIQSIKKFRKNGKILDIGSQKGEFLKHMQEEGWDVYGAEISSYACEYARNKLNLKNIYEGDILELDLPERFFDVFTFYDP